MNRQTQKHFSDIIRLQENVDNKRLKVYQSLFFNNLKNFIDNTFIVTKTLYSENDWHKLIHDFFIQHKSETPYFKDISQEFFKYYKTILPLHITQLMNYELAELRLYIKEGTYFLQQLEIENNINYKVSELAEIQHYQYPVHMINANLDNIKEKDTYLIVYRDIDFNINFIEINEITYLLIEELNTNTLLEIKEANNLDDVSFSFMINSVDNLLKKGILIKK